LAVSVTLPAFAAERRAAGTLPSTARRAPLLLSAGVCYRSTSPARGALSSKPDDARCCCRSMGQTDGRSGSINTAAHVTFSRRNTVSFTIKLIQHQTRLFLAFWLLKYEHLSGFYSY